MEDNKTNTVSFASAAKQAAEIANSESTSNASRAGRRKPQWRPEYGYPNRSMRRKYTNHKEVNTLTKMDINNGLTTLTKWYERVEVNVSSGKLRHESFLNDIYPNIQAVEDARMDRMKTNLIERFGNEIGMTIFKNNIKLQSEEMDKKILRG